jgi:hypothetical protein
MEPYETNWEHQIPKNSIQPTLFPLNEKTKPLLMHVVASPHWQQFLSLHVFITSFGLG